MCFATKCPAHQSLSSTITSTSVTTDQLTAASSSLLATNLTKHFCKHLKYMSGTDHSPGTDQSFMVRMHACMHTAHRSNGSWMTASTFLHFETAFFCFDLVSYDGPMMASKETSDVWNCQKECLNVIGCETFTFDTGTKNCSMKEEREPPKQAFTQNDPPILSGGRRCKRVLE